MFSKVSLRNLQGLKKLSHNQKLNFQLAAACNKNVQGREFSFFSKLFGGARKEEDLKRVEIDFASELQNGQMKELKVGETDDDVILISK